MRGNFIWVNTLTKFTVSPQFQTKALKEFVSIDDMKYFLKVSPAMKVKSDSIVARKSCQLKFEISFVNQKNLYTNEIDIELLFSSNVVNLGFF